MGMKTFSVDNITVPCTDCYITWWSAGLEYPDGSHANANTSMWLHHLGVLNTKRHDLSCTDRDAVERSLVSGNERQPVDLTMNGSVRELSVIVIHLLTRHRTSKTGYYIAANDTFHLVTELMNSVNDPRAAVVTLEWEFVRAISAKGAGGFRPVRAVFLDIDGACGSFTDTSDVDVPKGMSVFKLGMEPGWTANISGDIITTFTHLHDGGVLLETIKNGRVICSTVPGYGETPGFVDPMPTGDHGMLGMDMGGMAHVSSMKACENLGRVEVGDVWSVSASYNFTARPAMVDHHGQPVPIMGITGLYIVE